MASALPFPIATGKKKVVQVFECPQETWKSQKSATGRRPAKAKDAELSINEQIRKEFDETFESVKSFAAENLKGKEKKQHDAKRIEALGGKAAKNRSMPYNILTGIKKARAIREKKQEELHKQSDVVLGKRKRGKASEKKEKKKNMDYGLQATRGKFRNGVLNVSGL
ncbi:hypothetical protein Poli38472_000613 [Pythium oligandrum]|uniref:Uncharacterized protein n=1 Tax=Pythium oligandrum TaxID=41045 RepID=A0A8K1FFH8_PYTOL|nr:hypothetical protein Poli38472_000613 [Pythium oligandrum]|eukprot:TMW60571.1 hypothetical protein Poli38472_000613 [Pythium oligandrum]